MTAKGLKRTPLRRTSGLKRTGRLKPRNKERAAKRQAECFGEQAAKCRAMVCTVCGRWSPDELYRENVPFSTKSDPHHVPTRAAGGVDKDTVPLCRTHHTEWHDHGGKTFEAKYGVDLRAIAAALHEELQKQSDD